MAQYEIKHCCGHVVTHQIYGTNVHGEREREAARLEAKPCDECIAKEATERAARNGKNGTTVLKGSTKQIAWALSIRDEMIESIKEFEASQIEKAKTSGKDEETIAIFRTNIETAIKAVGDIDDAEWFINNKSSKGYYLVRKVLLVK